MWKKLLTPRKVLSKVKRNNWLLVITFLLNLMEGKLASPKPVRFTAVFQVENSKRRLFSESDVPNDTDVANAEVQQILGSREDLRIGPNTERTPSPSYRYLKKVLKPPSRSRCTKGWQKSLSRSSTAETAAHSL